MVRRYNELGTIEVGVEVFQALHYRQQLLPCDTIVALWLAELSAVVSDYMFVFILLLG